MSVFVSVEPTYIEELWHEKNTKIMWLMRIDQIRTPGMALGDPQTTLTHHSPRVASSSGCLHDDDDDDDAS